MNRKENSTFSFLALLIIFIFFLSGCAGPIHQMERSGLVQQTAAPITVRPGGTNILAICRDGTGNNMNIEARVIDQLRSRGKTVVANVNNADYCINSQTVSLSYRRDTGRSGGAGATLLGIGSAALAGGLVGGLTGSSTLGLIAAGAAGAAGAAVGHHLDQQVAPGIVTARVHIRIDERINFLNERQSALPEPTQKYRKVKKTTKSGKKVWVKEEVTEEEDAETPVKSTMAVAQSGAGTSTTVTDRRVAQFIPHESDFDVTLVVESNSSREEVLQRLEEKIAATIANSL